MPRAGVSAIRFDEGWEWIDPADDHDPVGDGEPGGTPSYYDWSLSGDFGGRPRTRGLRAVPDAAPRRRAIRPERPVGPPRSELSGRGASMERAVRAAAPVTPVAPVERATPVVPTVPGTSSTAPPVRRTVTITGRGAERHLYAGLPRPAARSYERAGFKPDRVAMWAVLLCVLMILAAATSAHAAPLH